MLPAIPHLSLSPEVWEAVPELEQNPTRDRKPAILVLTVSSWGFARSSRRHTPRTAHLSLTLLDGTASVEARRVWANSKLLCSGFRVLLVLQPVHLGAALGRQVQERALQTWPAGKFRVVR
jgi:hypothetical protein